MDIKEAIKAIKSNYPPSNYTMLREALDLAIETLEKQIQLSEYLRHMEKCNDYDTRLVKEVKDILREFVID